MNRRGFLTGIIAACAAPAIVRSGLIMPIKPALEIPVTATLKQLATPTTIDALMYGIMARNAEESARLLQDQLMFGVCAYRSFGAVITRIDPRKLLEAGFNQEGVKVKIGEGLPRFAEDIPPPTHLRDNVWFGVDLERADA